MTIWTFLIIAFSIRVFWLVFIIALLWITVINRDGACRALYFGSSDKLKWSFFILETYWSEATCRIILFVFNIEKIVKTFQSKNGNKTMYRKKFNEHPIFNEHYSWGSILFLHCVWLCVIYPLHWIINNDWKNNCIYEIADLNIWFFWKSLNNVNFSCENKICFQMNMHVEGVLI